MAAQTAQKTGRWLPGVTVCQEILEAVMLSTRTVHCRAVGATAVPTGWCHRSAWSRALLAGAAALMLLTAIAACSAGGNTSPYAGRRFDSRPLATPLSTPRSPTR
jgi:hypothetical protein